MDRPAEFSVEDADGGARLRLSGDWTAPSLGDAEARLGEAVAESSGKVAVDMTGVRRCDTAGAYAVLHAVGGRQDVSVESRDNHKRLLSLVDETLKAQPRRRRKSQGFFELLERLGRAVVGAGSEAIDTIAFLGHLILAVGRLFAKPTRIRWAACVSLAERAGLDALPIVTVTSFFIGAVVALLGANMLREFGAQVFAVELIGIAVLREFNIIITAVLLAGRSASSFAAEIGSMKMNQEIDAMQVLGVDPFEALVFPRFAALLLTIPLLTFAATLAGLVGGGLVTWAVLDLGPAFFMQRIVDNVGATNFWIGMSKAPVMAAVIAGIGCRQGMEVGDDVESLGRRVTAAVVHAIFSIILIDAIFALIYMELDL